MALLFHLFIYLLPNLFFGMSTDDAANHWAVNTVLELDNMVLNTSIVNYK